LTGIWYKYSGSPFIFQEKYICSYYNFTVVNGSIHYVYRYQDPNRSNFEDLEIAELIIDYVENKIYLVVTYPPPGDIYKMDWVPVNSTDVVAFAGCVECGFYGTQDAGRNYLTF
jgi:hypothetical protein